MPKFTAIDLGSLANQTTFLLELNENFTRLEEAIEKTLTRQSDTPNTMESPLDMNGNRIYNLPNAVANTEPLTIGQFYDLVEALNAGGGGGGGGGVSGDIAYATTRAAIKALNTSTTKAAVLNDHGRSGVFLWNFGDFSVQVAADTQEGLYLKADALASNIGAWVRVPQEEYSVDWFGAAGDNATDDAPAIQAANNFLSSTGLGGVIKLGPKSYRVGSTINVPVSVTVHGNGSAAVSRLIGNHNTGPVISFNDQRASLRDIEINATTARTIGPSGFGSEENCGILFKGLFPEIENVRVYNQPSSGVILSGATYVGYIEGLSSSNNKIHGICIDPGDEIGAPSFTVPGLLEIIQPSLNDNGGHAIAIGRPTSAGAGANALRVVVRNGDLNNNGTNATKLYEDAAIYARGTLITIENTAISGGTSRNTQGIYAKGYYHRYINNRFFYMKGDTLAYMIDGADTTGILIDGINVETSITPINVGQPDARLLVAVGVDATVPTGAVTIVPRSLTGYTALLTTTAAQNVTLPSQIQVPAGTAAAPGYALANDPNTGITSLAADSLSISTGGIARTTWVGNIFRPHANDGMQLGSNNLSWSDLFLANGGIINWNNGDATITHNTDKLTFAGATAGYEFDAPISTGVAPIAGIAFAAESTGSFLPQIMQINRSAGATAPYWSTRKARGPSGVAGSEVQANDAIGNFVFQGLATDTNTWANAATITASVVSSGATTVNGRIALGCYVAGAIKTPLIVEGSNCLAGLPSLATTATEGFLYVPTCAGVPTGVPVTVTGRAPIVVNSTNNQLYFYSGGAWRNAGP